MAATPAPAGTASGAAAPLLWDAAMLLELPMPAMVMVAAMSVDMAAGVMVVALVTSPATALDTMEKVIGMVLEALEALD